MDFQKELERVAQEYRDEGYAVVTHPGKDHLNGLAEVVAELLATRGTENVPVQVKNSRDDAELDGKTTPIALLQTLYGNGFLSRAEYDRARTAWTIRTQAVHGYVAADIDPSLVDDVLALANKVKAGEEVLATAV